MKRLIIVSITVFCIGISNSYAWGELGHRIVVEIAKRHLTETLHQLTLRIKT